MSLEGAKLICLNADDNGQFETISAIGKTFKFGYYMDCDVVLEHPDAMGLQCVINCDAFGRVTIENRCSDQPITLDGKTLIKMRPLLHNTEICILNKKYLWHFDGNPIIRGFQMEDVNDFTTPSKQIKKPQQPPNSEPARKWRRPLQTRLTIHSFAYCIKAGESPKDVETNTDENKPSNIHERIDADVSNKRLSSSPTPPPENTSDFIDLKTPKIEQRPFTRRDQPLSCCKLSETVITSYSPRETGIRQEKSFAVVQSPMAATNKSKITDISLGPFQHVASPQTMQNYRSSMHLIDLITPKKLIQTASSPTRTLLKSTLKKNLHTGTSPQTPQKKKNIIEMSTPGSSETVYSVRSTDDESVIILSDDCSGSPASPIAKTPPRIRTPQSLMKRAILSSAKNFAGSKKLLNLTGSKQTFTPTTAKNATTVRFQSQSTPQRKSLGRFSSSVDSLSSGKPRKSLVTSTPFRQRAEIITSSSSKRSLLINPQSSSQKESRNSLMLKQALSMTPSSTSLTQKRKSISCRKSPNKSRKSVSFLQRNVVEVEKADVDQSLNSTFTIEHDSKKNDIELDHVANSYSKNVSPEKEELELLKVSLSPEKLKQTESRAFSSGAKFKDQALHETALELGHSFSFVSQRQIERESNEEDLNDNKNLDSQSPQFSKMKMSGGNLKIRDDTDFDSADDIFKTPKAKNLMILSSPKSISLQKTGSDSVELIHSTEFELSANLGDLFQTPQSELLTTRGDSATPAINTTCSEALSPEEAFDMLAGRPIIKKIYTRNTPPKKELSPLKILNDPTFPKTDIEEWIDSVNDLLDDPQEKDEMSYLTTSMDEISRDPLMTHSVAEKKVKVINTPRDEVEMTIKEENEYHKSNQSALKDPLQTTIPRSFSPNISGIGLLDHTSESIFSETLAVSDGSSLKEVEKTMKISEDPDETTLTANEKQLNVSQEDRARREIEEAFKNFENERKVLDEKRLASTPEAKKPSISKVTNRRTIGNQISSDSKFDLKTIKAMKNEDQRQLNAKELVKSMSETITLENERKEIRIPDVELQNTESEVELAAENGKTAEVIELIENNIEQQFTLAQNVASSFENFEQQQEVLELREVKTPEPTKVAPKDLRRTLGSTLITDRKLDLEAAKAEREMELAFENFDENPEFLEQREVKTPEPIKVASKDHRRTLGSALITEVELDLQAAKAEREMKLAFENFEENPEFLKQREFKTPEQTKVGRRDHRRTLGSALITEVKLDLQAAKAEREMELAFENFEENPEYSEQREVKTPEHIKVASKDNRRTLGSALITEAKLDIQAAKAEREMELAFENFEENPEFSEQREVKTPEPTKVASKDHRRTLGSALITEVKLDLQTEKAEREMELAFENFKENPKFLEQREFKTPEQTKVGRRDHRRTLGSALITEVKLDLQAAKAEREMELAFENFEENPEYSEQREVKTPELIKVASKDNRRTLGSALITEAKLDIQAAKAEREMELAFENFEENPEFSEQREVKTPEPTKVAPKDHRRTLGSALITEVKLDLQAAKAEREMEMAFENFEEEPEFSEQREVKTPEPTRVTSKDHRRTLGSALITEVKLDLQAAKAEREMELAFENFKENPEFLEQREFKTPEQTKVGRRDHRRTLGSALITEVKIDLQAAKAEREMELDFENFEENPEYSEQREVKTPEPTKVASKDHRRTLGSALITEVKLDLQAAKAEREMEMAFENFEEEPEFSEQRDVKTPEPTRVTSKDHRRTLGSALITEVKLDLQAAKAEREMELAFENFEENPEYSEQREIKTPEPIKVASKDNRRTLGSALITEVKLDLQAAKAEREMELAFENFEENPEFSEQREVKTPEPTKVTSKDHRRTLGSALITEVQLDLQAAKAEREIEMAFENFEEEPEFSEQREVKTPEPARVTSKDHRRTLGSALITEVKLDLQAAKAEREMELAFENFKENPEFLEQREFKTPEQTKVGRRDHRRTLGSALITEVKTDLQAAKAEREMELDFENFEENPEYSEQREVKTPEPTKVASKDHRRTLGSALITEVKLDLQAAKAEREMEMAFENFEEEPEFSEQRDVKTPEPTRVTSKDHRRTLGSALITEVKLDLQAAKAEREMELAFENFEENPEYSEQREIKTPEPIKVASKDNRRTLGSALITEVKLDLQAAKAEREMELDFENFEENPEFLEQREFKTPEPTKVASKDHRRTLGSALITEVKLDLQAAKAEREMELAFENFEENPEFSEQREVKTPEPTKVTSKDHRRTLGSALITEVQLDLQAAKAEREIEMAFENFEEEPEFSEQREVKTPEPARVTSKDHRRTLGSALITEVKLDLQAAKAEREMELAFENFDEELEFSEQRDVKTLEPTKVKDSNAFNTSQQENRSKEIQVVKEEKLDRKNYSNILKIEEYFKPGNNQSCEKVPPKDSSKRERQSEEFNAIEQQEKESPALRRTLKKTVKIVDDLKDDESKTPMQKTSQNTIDLFIEDKNPLTQHKDAKTSNMEDERIKYSIVRMDSTDVDFTDKEESQTSKNPHKKRIRRTASKISETPLKETNLPILEPIHEEAINSVSKITNEYIEARSLTSVTAVADEIIKLTPVASTSRVREHKAQLNVVLIKSNAASIIITDGESAKKDVSVNDNIDTHEDGNSKEVCSEKFDVPRSSDESIPSTPLRLSSGRRKPSKTKESTNVLVRALRRTRRGSVQQDIEIQNVDKLETPLKTNDSSSKSNNSDKSELDNDILSTEVGNEDIVPSTPLHPTKTRQRKLPHKQKALRKSSGKEIVSTLEQDDPGIVKKKFEEFIEKKELYVNDDMQSNTEATKTEYSIQSQENIVEETSNPASYENVNNTQTQTTTQKIQSYKKTEKSVDMVTLQLTSEKLEQKIVSESVISENYQTKLDFEKPAPTSPVISKILCRRRTSKVKETVLTKSSTICDKVFISQNQQGSNSEELTTEVEDEQSVATIPGLSKIRVSTAAPQMEENLQFTSEKFEKKIMSERVLSESIQTESPTICDENIISPNQQVDNIEVYTTNIDDKKLVPTSPILPKKSGHRAVPKVHLDPESVTPNRQARSSKKKMEVQTELAGQVSAQEKYDDQTVLQTSSSATMASAAIQSNNTPPITTNTRVENSKTNKKIVFGSSPTNETPSAEDNDEKLVKLVQFPFSEAIKSLAAETENGSAVHVEKIIPTKTRGRRVASVNPENAEKAVNKRGRKRAVGQISDSSPEETENQDEVLELISQDCHHENYGHAVPSKKRGRKAAVKIEPAVPTPVIVSPNTVLTTSCTDETQNQKGRDALYHDEEHLNHNESPTDDEINIASKTRGRRAAAVKPAAKSSCKRTNESAEQQLQQTEEHAEGVKNESREENDKISNVIEHTPVPVKKRGRKASVKIEPTPEIATPVRRAARRQPVGMPISNTLPNEEVSEEQPLQGTEIRKKEVVEANVQDCQEENDKIADVSQQTPLPVKKRGRKAVVNIEAAVTPAISTPARRGGRKKPAELPISNGPANERIFEVQQLQGTEDHEEELVAENVRDCQRETDKIADVIEQTPVPVKKRGRKASVNIEAVVTPASSVSTRRCGRRNPPEIPVSNAPINEEIFEAQELQGTEESEEEVNKASFQNYKEKNDKTRDVIQQTPVLVKKRGRKASVKIEAAPPSAAIPARRVAQRQSVEMPISNADKKLEDKNLGEKTGELPIDPLSSKSRGHNVENAATESNIEIPKSRGRKANKKTEVVDSSNDIKDISVTDEDKPATYTGLYPVKSETITPENSPSIQKLGKKRSAAQEENSFEKEIEILNESSITDGNIYENVPAKKRTRGAPAKLTEFIVSNLVQTVKSEVIDSDGSDSEVYNSVVRKKSGQPATVKLENVEITQENSSQEQKNDDVEFTHEAPIPTRKRGRPRASNKNESASTRKVGRHGMAQQKADVASNKEEPKCDSKASCDLVSHEENSKRKQTRGVRANSVAASLSFLDEKEQQTKNEVETQNKLTRGNGKAHLKNNSILECSSISQLEEEQTEPKTKPKPNRGRKATTKIEPEKEITQEKPFELNYDISLDKIQNENKDKVDEKPKRGRPKKITEDKSSEAELNMNISHSEDKKIHATPKRGRRNAATKTEPEKEIAQGKTTEPKLNTILDKSQNEDKEKVYTKPKGGGRKAAAEPTVENISPVSIKQSPVVTKKTTRGRKAAVKTTATESDDNLNVQTSKLDKDKDTKPVAKRRNLEITSDEQQETPSKRTRRKPNKLHEFIT